MTREVGSPPVKRVETDVRTSRRMSAQRSKDTGPELALRRALHARGLRYRVHVRTVVGLRREADLVFGPSKVAVFVDGCFWHGCSVHGTSPRHNATWWRAKIDRNIERDRETDHVLTEEGWHVVRVWDHEDALLAAEQLAQLIAERRTRRAGGQQDHPVVSRH